MINMFEIDWVSSFSFFCRERQPANIIDFFLAHQALDVYIIPTGSKQSFVYQVHILCKTTQETYFCRLIAENYTPDFQLTRQERYKLRREFRKIEIAGNPLLVKCGYIISHGKKYYLQLKPEYEDCKKLAQIFNRPVREVYQIAMKKARAGLNP